MNYPNTRGFIARSTYADLMQTTFETFKTVYDKIAYPRIGAMNYNDKYKRITFPNGSFINLMYTQSTAHDKENARMGSYEYTDGFIDEASEVKGDTIMVMTSRIRWNLINDKKPVLLCSNPGRGFLKNHFIKDNDGVKAVLKDYELYIQAKVDDNPDKKFVKAYKETLERLPEFHRKRLLDGDWDYQVDDYDFCSDGKHINIVECNIAPYYPILLAFDFNHNPTTCHIMQKVSNRLSEGGGIFIYKTFSEKGGTENLCLHLKPYIEKLYDEGFQSIINITGDHSGTHHTSSSGNVNDFMIIQNMLNIPTHNFINTNRVNPKHVYSRTLINHLYKAGVVTIHPDCISLLNDIRIAKTKENGGLYKDRDSGHGMDALDAHRYGIHAMFESTREIDKWIYAIG